MNISQKEKLEQELNFLKESFEAEVISKDEFEKGKERIEKKLKEFNLEQDKSPKEKVEIKEEIKKEEKEDKEVSSEDSAKESKEEHKAHDTSEIRIIEDNPEEKNIEVPVTLKIKKEEKEEEKEPARKEKGIYENSEPKKKSRKWVWIVLILILASVYYIYSHKDTQSQTGSSPSTTSTTIKALNKQSSNLKLIIISGRDCFNCDAARMTSVIESWFGNVEERELDYESEEGKKLIEKININILPAYILNSEISKIEKFEEVRQVFIKEDNLYVMNPDATGSTFYFKRENMDKRIDLFVKEGDANSKKAMANAKSFIENSESEITLEVHDINSAIAKELGIKSIPSFLVNNRIKFPGVQPPEVIKQNFCKINDAKVCNKSLSKSFI